MRSVITLKLVRKMFRKDLLTLAKPMNIQAKHPKRSYVCYSYRYFRIFLLICIIVVVGIVVTLILLGALKKF